MIVTAKDVQIAAHKLGLKPRQIRQMMSQAKTSTRSPDDYRRALKNLVAAVELTCDLSWTKPGSVQAEALAQACEVLDVR